MPRLEKVAHQISPKEIRAAFVAERCLTGKGKEALAGDLYLAYRGWAESSGEKPVTQAMFGRRLDEMGFPFRKSGGKILRQGIELREVAILPT